MTSPHLRAIRAFLFLFSCLLAVGLTAGSASADNHDKTFSQDELPQLFGDFSEDMGNVLQRIFMEYGEPNVVITGEEVSGAFLFGLTYGKGVLKNKPDSGISSTVYWQGPSFGFDFGGEITRTSILVYNLNNAEDLFQRFPGLAGKAFLVGGIGVTYVQSEDIVLAVIRSGVGIRGGVNTGYLKFRKENTILPF